VEFMLNMKGRKQLIYQDNTSVIEMVTTGGALQGLSICVLGCFW